DQPAAASFTAGSAELVLCYGRETSVRCIHPALPVLSSLTRIHSSAYEYAVIELLASAEKVTEKLVPGPSRTLPLVVVFSLMGTANRVSPGRASSRLVPSRPRYDEATVLA